MSEREFDIEDDSSPEWDPDDDACHNCGAPYDGGARCGKCGCADPEDTGDFCHGCGDELPCLNDSCAGTCRR